MKAAGSDALLECTSLLKLSHTAPSIRPVLPEERRSYSGMHGVTVKSYGSCRFEYLEFGLELEGRDEG